MRTHGSPRVPPHGQRSMARSRAVPRPMKTTTCVEVSAGARPASERKVGQVDREASCDRQWPVARTLVPGASMPRVHRGEARGNARIPEPVPARPRRSHMRQRRTSLRHKRRTPSLHDYRKLSKAHDHRHPIYPEGRASCRISRISMGTARVGGRLVEEQPIDAKLADRLGEFWKCHGLADITVGARSIPREPIAVLDR